MKIWKAKPKLLISAMDGGSLERRVVRLLEKPWARRWRVSAAVACAVVMTVASLGVGMVAVRPSMAQDSKEAAKLQAFDAVTIKPFGPNDRVVAGFYGYPGGRVMYGGNARMLVEYAFNLQDYQLSGVPGWGSAGAHDAEWFQINGVPPEDSAARTIKLAGGAPTGKQQQMLQSLLRDRFGLKYHFETKEDEVYLLSRGRGTLRLKPPANPDRAPRAIVFGHDQKNGDVVVQGYNTTTDYLAGRLSYFLHLPVLNQTGISGVYDFELPPPDSEETHDMAAYSLSVANQLGLKIKRGRGSIQILVIDHIEKPTED